MLSGMRILAACGMVGAMVSIGVAQNPYAYDGSSAAYEPSPSRTGSEFFSRGGEDDVRRSAPAARPRPRSGAPRLKNYHEALFGAPKPTQQARATTAPVAGPVAERPLPPRNPVAQYQRESERDAPVAGSPFARNRTSASNEDDVRTAYRAQPPTPPRQPQASQDVNDIEDLIQRTSATRPSAQTAGRSSRSMPYAPEIPSDEPALDTDFSGDVMRAEYEQNRDRRPARLVQPVGAVSNNSNNTSPFRRVADERDPMESEPVEQATLEEKLDAPAISSRSATTREQDVVANDPVEPKPAAPRGRLTSGRIAPVVREAVPPRLETPVMDLTNRGRLQPAEDRAERGAPARSFDAVATNSRVDARPESSGPQTPSVTLEWVKRGDVNVGQECEIELVVRNSGQVLARELSVEAQFPPAVRLTAVDPRPAETGGTILWKFSDLPSGSKETIRIKLVPSQRGELATNAVVRFSGNAAAMFEVKEPMVKVSVDGPHKAMSGDPVAHTISVTNPGTGVAHNVAVQAILPEGLEHPRGKTLSYSIGSLSPGETRTVRLTLAAVAGGPQAVKVNVVADASHSGDRSLAHSAVHSTTVATPSLKLKVDGPGLRYVGRDAQFTVGVTNDGVAATDNVRVQYATPEGYTFVKADRGGKFDPQSGTANWFVGRIEAGETVDLHVRLESKTLGSYSHRASAVSEQGAKAQAEYVSIVEGAAALVLEIVDLDDPVEVGGETAYEIRVRNEGSKAAGNVGVSCEMSSGVKLVEAKGPTSALSESGLVMFKALRSLEPGKTATYRVHVKGMEAGNHRFRARLASDSIEEPLIFEELTKFYVD